MNIWNEDNTNGETNMENIAMKFPPCNDEYISFERTNYKNPYSNLCLLEMEDIFGYMLSYKRPFDKGDIGYLIRKKKKLHSEICKRCYRLSENREYQPYHLRPDITIKGVDHEASKKEQAPVTFTESKKGFLTCDNCRVMKLKQSINYEIKGDCGVTCLLGAWPRRRTKT